MTGDPLPRGLLGIVEEVLLYVWKSLQSPGNPNMLPEDILDRVLSPGTSLRTLRVLFREPKVEFTGRALARRAKASPPQTSAALQRLEGIGLVRRKVTGRADTWTLVRDHALIPVLTKLFDSERNLRPRLRAELQDELESLGVKNAMIFGSVARGEATINSDLDLFVEVPTTDEAVRLRDALPDVQLRFLTKYGTMVSPLILTASQARRPSNPPLLESIRRDSVPVSEEG